MDHNSRNEGREEKPEQNATRPPQRPQPPDFTSESRAAAQPYFVAADSQEAAISGGRPSSFSDFAPGTTDAASTPKKPISIKLILSATVFGALFALLVVKQSAGLNVMLLVLMAYGFAALNRDLFITKGIKDAPLMYAMTLPVVALAVLVFLSQGVMSRLSIPAIICIMSAQYMVLSGTALHDWDRPAFLIDAVMVWVNKSLIGMGQYLSGLFGRLFKKSGGHKKGVALGILSGVALLVIVVPILAAADEQAQQMLQEFFGGWETGDVFLYLFVFLVAASVIMGPVALAKRAEFSGQRKPMVSLNRRPVHASSVAIALSMLAVVYVLFAALQISYLFRPSDTVAQVMGLTRSAYAVRGFGEMVAVSVLNFALLGLLLRFSKKPEGKLAVFEKVLYTLLIIFNFVILASANMRMSYYEAAFGFTVARVLSHSFMVLAAVVNAVMLVRIYVRFNSVKLVLALCVLYFTALAAIGPERFVTQRNIERYETTGTIDAEYSLLLPGGAKVQICEFLQSHPGAMTRDLEQTARDELERYQARIAGKGWQSLNIVEQRATEALEALVEK